MTSFQLVNHQLKHMFGGIEAEKNSSLEYLETIQKKITKTMEKAQANHMKIYQAIATVKASLTELNENYLAISKESKHSGGLISKLTCEITDILQDVSEQSLSLAKKMESKVETSVPNLKKIKEKYTECAQTLEHYRKKVSLLKKNVERQTLANVKQDEHERFERNKEKLRNAEKQYDQILMKTTKRYVEFNTESLKDLQNDFISVLTNIGANVMEFSNNLTKHLCQNFSTHQILLSKQLKIPKKGSEKIHSLESQLKLQKESSEQTNFLHFQEKKAFYEHLTEQRQIQNYLKKIIEKEMAKQKSQKIQQVFKAKKSVIIAQKQDTTGIPFTQFQNIYNNHELKHHHHNLLEKLKEEDPIQACEDLLEMEQGTQITQISRGFERQEMSRADIETSPQLEKPSENHFQDRMKKNLDKFNKICEQNHLERRKSPTQTIKPLEKAISPNLKAIQSYKIQNNNYNSSKTVLKSPDQFFNLSYLENQKKIESIKTPQNELIKLHEQPFNFTIFEQGLKPNFTKPSNLSPRPSSIIHTNHGNPTIKSTSAISNPTIKPSKQSGPISFDNFDFFMKEHCTSEAKSSLQPKQSAELRNSQSAKNKKLLTEGITDLLNL